MYHAHAKLCWPPAETRQPARGVRHSLSRQSLVRFEHPRWSPWAISRRRRNPTHRPRAVPAQRYRHCMWSGSVSAKWRCCSLSIARVSCRKRSQTACPPPSRMSERCSVHPGVARRISSECKPVIYFLYKYTCVCIHSKIYLQNTFYPQLCPQRHARTGRASAISASPHPKSPTRHVGNRL